jgi:LuxR family maltose regulon positive regulatory protein
VSPAIHAAFHVSLALQRHDLPAALEWGNRLSGFGDGALDTWSQHIPIRLLIARGEKVAAVQKLLGLYDKAVQADAQGYVIRVRVYQSLAAETPDEALTFLSEALRLGQPEGFIRTFVDEGRYIKPLLEKALSQGITPEYTAKLLDIIEKEEQLRQAADAKQAQVPTSVKLLSDRELEILRLVANGLTNRQIADRLFITPGTAKRHVHNIFEKLDAGDRLHAVNRARELKLL